MSTYEEIRDTIKTGHVILWENHSFPWCLFKTWTKYTHCSLIVRIPEFQNLKDRIWLFEMQRPGLVFRLLSDEIKNYPGKVYILQPNIHKDQEVIIRDFAFTELAKGRVYDLGGLFLNMLGHVSMHIYKYLCSSWPWRCWLEANLFYPKMIKGVSIAPRPADLPLWTRLKPLEIL